MIMQQMTFDDYQRDLTDWTQKTRTMLDQLISQEELPKGSLYLSDNYSSDSFEDYEAE